MGPIISTPAPTPTFSNPEASDCLFLKNWLITTRPDENAQLEPKPYRRLYVKKRTHMFSAKELAIKLTTENAPPMSPVMRQPNRVIRAVDRGPAKKVNAMATEPSHAEIENK